MTTLVTVDTREPDWVRELEFGGALVTSAPLSGGDVCVATSDALLVIERKTATDLLNTLREDRLFGQVAKMRELSPWCYVVITGTLQRGEGGYTWADQRKTGWNWESVQGALLTVQELGVGVIHSDDNFEATVLRLASRDRGVQRVAPPRTTHVLSPGQAAVAALPGIGFDRTTALLAHCGTPAWVLVALTDMTDISVPGIGRGIKGQVRKALGLEDWQSMEIMDNREYENDGAD